MDKIIFAWNILLLVVIFIGLVVYRLYSNLGQDMHAYLALTGVVLYTMFAKCVYSMHVNPTQHYWKLTWTTALHSIWTLLVAAYVYWIADCFFTGAFMHGIILIVILISLGGFLRLAQPFYSTPKQ
jgi:membrane-associated HD superfamily phosphohydrolase